MRLIDAEPLVEYFEQNRIDDIDLMPDASFAYDIAKQAVEEAETVEAIPIRWLKRWGASTYASYETSKELLFRISYKPIILQAIEDWKKEQNDDTV